MSAIQRKWKFQCWRVDYNATDLNQTKDFTDYHEAAQWLADRVCATMSAELQVYSAHLKLVRERI